MSLYQNILNPVTIQELARKWLQEDLPGFDLQGLIAGDAEIVAKIYCKSPGVLAGVPFANGVLQEVNLSPNWFFNEGEFLDPGHCSSGTALEVAYVGGKARDVLLAERLLLNIISRCSGVATKSRRIRDKLNKSGWPGFLAGTRKTTPGFRLVEKYGLLVGGAAAHRHDLSHMVMIKDNHVTISGSIQKAVQVVRSVAGFSSKIEVECQTLEEAKQAALAAVDIIMLDNFLPPNLESVSKWIKNNYPSILVEASGGITESNVLDYALPSVDIVSLSSLVQGYEAIDFSMKVLSS